jgi:hypothetical protein
LRSDPAEVGNVGSSIAGNPAAAFPVGDSTLAESTSSIGAGAAISEGKNIRELTANKATKKTNTIRNGATT